MLTFLHVHVVHKQHGGPHSKMLQNTVKFLYFTLDFFSWQGFDQLFPKNNTRAPRKTAGFWCITWDSESRGVTVDLFGRPNPIRAK